jgi:hypothetical protein
LLLSDAVALAKRGVMDAQRLKELKGLPGYKNIAFGLLALVAMFREKWSVLDGKMLLQASELKHVQLLADRLISAVGDREQTPTQIDAAERRQRAFSLFVKAYDQARRAIQYVRWEQGDADSIAPSLYSGRGNRNVKRRAEDAQVTPAPVVQVPASAVNSSAASSLEAPLPVQMNRARVGRCSFGRPPQMKSRRLLRPTSTTTKAWTAARSARTSS